MTAKPMSPSRQSSRVARRWRLLLVTLAVIVLLVGLPQLILTTWGPGFLERLLSKRLQTSVTVQRLTGGWWSGLNLYRLIIAESPAQDAPTLVHIGRLSVNLPLLPLLVSSKPVSLQINDAMLRLPRREDGTWPMPPLAVPSNPQTPPQSGFTLPFKLLKRHVEVTLTDGHMLMRPHAPPYELTAHVWSQSLTDAPLRGQLTLSRTRGESLAIQGQVDQAVGPGPLTGHADITMTQLDLAAVTALIPMTIPFQEQGQVKTAHVRVVLRKDTGLNVDANVDLRQIVVPDTMGAAETTLERVQLQLRGGWHQQRWSCEALSLQVPGGRFALVPPAWLQVDEKAWRGHVTYTLDMQDMQTVTQALAGLWPAELRLAGGLRLQGHLAGAFEHGSQMSFDKRIAGLHIALKGQLDKLQWQQEIITAASTELRLHDRVLTIAHTRAKVSGGSLELQGHLSLQDDTPHGEVTWHVADLPLHRILGAPLKRAPQRDGCEGRRKARCRQLASHTSDRPDTQFRLLASHQARQWTAAHAAASGPVADTPTTESDGRRPRVTEYNIRFRRPAHRAR